MSLRCIYLAVSHSGYQLTIQWSPFREHLSFSAVSTADSTWSRWRLSGWCVQMMRSQDFRSWLCGWMSIELCRCSALRFDLEKFRKKYTNCNTQVLMGKAMAHLAGNTPRRQTSGDTATTSVDVSGWSVIVVYMIFYKKWWPLNKLYILCNISNRCLTDHFWPQKMILFGKRVLLYCSNTFS